jgi:hypothetical protein
MPLSLLGVPSPRTELPLSSDAIIVGNFTLVRGKQSPGGWQGPVYPNASSTNNTNPFDWCANDASH